MRSVAFFAAALSLAVIAAGCGGTTTAAETKTCSFALAPNEGWLMYANDPSAEFPDGSIVVGATRQRHGKVSIVLQRLTHDCEVVRSFGRDGTASIATPGTENGELDVLHALPGGGLLLAGSAGGHRELVGRLLPNGTLDRSFGTDGWTSFTPQVENPGMGTGRIATSIAVAPSGSIFLGGNDATAHCCTVDYVSKLTRDGALVQGFGDGGTLILPGIAGSYRTDVSANPDGTVYAFAEYEQSGCGYPVVDRIRSDGSLDRRFDTAMAQTLRRIAGGRLGRGTFRFTPTFVPGTANGFVLLGGLDKTCALPSPHQPSEGAAVTVTPAGRMTGEKRFPSPNYAFDSPIALRLPSGAIVAAAELYGRHGIRSVIVRSFASDGTATGVSTIPRESLHGMLRLDGLLPASGGGAWLLMSSRKRFELIPVR